MTKDKMQRIFFKAVAALTFFIVYFIMLAGPCFSEERFVYNSHGRRDPFVPLVGPKKERVDVIGIAGITSIEDVDLQGVAYDSKGKKFAIINGEIIKVGETIAKVTLKEIKDDDITILIDGEEYYLSLYEGREDF